MTALQYTLGVDPGLSGALALVHKTTQAIITYSMPTQTVKSKTVLDPVALASWIDVHSHLISHAYVEQVTSRPRQAGQLLMGVNAGVLHGILYANCIRFTQVSPAAWKAWYGLKRDELETYRDAKNHSRTLAIEMFPHHAQAYKRVKDDGVAEASLIALYGLNQGK